MLLFLLVSSILLWYAWDYHRSRDMPPGPFKLPILGNLLSVNPDTLYDDFNKLALKYGGVLGMQMGSNFNVILTSPEAAKEALLTKGSYFSDRWQMPTVATFSNNWTACSFANGSAWREGRKRIIRGIKENWPEILKVIDEEMFKMTAKIKKIALTGQLVHIEPIIRITGFNIMLRLTLGKDAIEDLSESPLAQNVNDIIQCLSAGNPRDSFNFLKYFPWFEGDKKREKLVKLKQDYIQSAIDEFRRNPKKHQGGVLKYWIDNPGEEVPIQSLVHDFILPGTDTPPLISMWGIIYLLNNPDKLAKAHAEMDAIIGRGRELQFSDKENLPYLDALVKEVIRIRVPSPLGVPHFNVKEATIGGYRIPAGSVIMLNQYGLANHPKLWKRPEEFRPERFLEEEKHLEYIGPQSVDDIDKLKYVVMSLGRRYCAGYAMAVVLPFMFLGRLIHHFEITVDGKVPSFEADVGLQFQPLNRPAVRIKPRF